MAAGELVHEHPPFPSDRRLAQAVMALEGLALDEQWPDSMRRDARLCEYNLCYEHANNTEKDWTWVVEDLAPKDKYITFLIKSAMDVSAEPVDDADLNVLAMWRLVKLEINDCWADHIASCDNDSNIIQCYLRPYSAT